jgi:hypothetical protein
MTGGCASAVSVIGHLRRLVAGLFISLRMYYHRYEQVSGVGTVLALYDWFTGKHHRRENARAAHQTASKTQPLHRLREAIATISAVPLHGKDATGNTAIAAAALTKAVAKQTIGPFIADDDDRFIAGIFAIVFADYFSRALDADFDRSLSSALLKVLGEEEIDRCAKTILNAYDEMVETDSTLLRAIGLNCKRWYQDPTPERFQKLVEACALQTTVGDEN